MSNSAPIETTDVKTDPRFSTPTRIPAGEPPQITGGVGADGADVDTARRALDLAEQANARLFGAADASPERLSQFVSYLLRISGQDFNRLPLRKREASSIEPLRDVVPRCEWSAWVERTGAPDALDVHKAWERLDATDAGAAEFMRTVHLVADKYRRGENELAGYFERKPNFALVSELYVDLLENIYRLGRGPLRLILVGNEALAFRDAAHGIFYKLVLNRGSGTAGLRAAGIYEGPLYRVVPKGVIEGGPVFHDRAKAIEIADTVAGTVTELEPRLIALGSCGIPLVEQLLGSRNRFPGFVFTEIVGITPTGDLVVKQAEAKGRPPNAAAVKKWARHHGHAVLPSAYHPQLQTESLATPVLMQDKAGEFAVALDLRARNGKISASGRVEIFDPMILPLARSEVEESPILRTAAKGCATPD